MPNFKKFVALSLGAVCLMTSCNHTVNADSAKKFIENNYGDKVIAKEIDSIAINYNTKFTNKTSECTTLAKTKAQGFASSCKYSLSEDKYSFNIDPLDKTSTEWSNVSGSMSTKLMSEFIDICEGMKSSGIASNIIYTTSSNELSIYTKYNEFDEGNFKKNIESLYIFNKCGQNRYKKYVENYIANDKNTVTTTTIYIATYKA